MKTTYRALGALTILGIAGLVWAGDVHKRCTLPTQQCLDQMAEKMKTMGWIGVELDDARKGDLLTVTQVVPGSPAEQSGIRPGDLFVAADGTPISASKPDALQKAKGEWKPGKKVVLTIRRDGVDRDVAVEMTPMPADMLARYIGEHMLEHAAMAAARH